MANFCHIEIVCIILELLVVSSYCQDTIIFRNDDQVSSRRNVVETSSSIPEQLLIRMKDVYNATDFLNRFTTRNDDAGEVENGRPNITSRRGLASVVASSVSQFAACKPELQTVELEKPQNAAIFLWPPCVRVRRCGGCCTSKMLTCHPVVTSILNVTVLKARYNPQAPETFETQDTSVISLEQHDRCRCSCKEQPEHCTPSLQEYRQNECRCVCINQGQAAICTGPNKEWDSRHCLCRCRLVQQCSTGRYFNHLRCRCEAVRISLDTASQVLPEDP